MDQKQNPVQSKGNKNVFCPYYSDCLDHAAKRYWEYWACFECQYKREQKLNADFRLFSVNADPYYSISPSLYEKAKKYSS